MRPQYDLTKLAQLALDTAKAHKLTIITAESCTAGKLATLLSEQPGAAELLHGGFVTYTKENKTKALGVPEGLLARHSAVCPAVAHAMADGALVRSAASISVAITGVAGPAPDEDDNPVGRVCLAVACVGRGTETRELEYGNLGRDTVQARAMSDALHMLINIAGCKITERN